MRRRQLSGSNGRNVTGQKPWLNNNKKTLTTKRRLVRSSKIDNSKPSEEHATFCRRKRHFGIVSNKSPTRSSPPLATAKSASPSSSPPTLLLAPSEARQILFLKRCIRSPMDRLIFRSNRMNLVLGNSSQVLAKILKRGKFRILPRMNVPYSV